MAKAKKALTPDTINFKHPYSYDTPLHCAAASSFAKRKGVVETLYRKGANLNDKNKDLLTPLHLAADKSHYDVVEVSVFPMTLESLFAPKTPYSKINWHWVKEDLFYPQYNIFLNNIFHLFAYLQVLLKNGAKVNALDNAGQTALHRCARADNVQACRILLNFGADPSIVSLQGYTAAQLAASDGVAKLLAEEPTASSSPAAAGTDVEYQGRYSVFS